MRLGYLGPVLQTNCEDEAQVLGAVAGVTGVAGSGRQWQRVAEKAQDSTYPEQQATREQQQHLQRRQRYWQPS